MGAKGSMKRSKPKPPVAWLFGRGLISSLKGTLLYTAFGNKLDPRDWMHPKVISFAENFEGDDFWFDYISDTGDGQKATYSIAYLTQSYLWVDDYKTAIGSTVGLQSSDTINVCLPRGSFLFVGGDTSYHVANIPTLKERFVTPFKWAYEDLKKAGQTDDKTHVLLGIPGNHDYYDALDGFNYQFCKPFKGKGPHDQLSIPGFERRQEASYNALKLPFGWWFLGLDAQGGKIDKRQYSFFTETVGAAELKKGILATPEPSTVFGKRAKDHSPLAETLKKLGMQTPFLEDGKLEEGMCRLDLSGDIHHYTRYWGPSSSNTNTAPSSPNYASVVSGSGGAFLHPTDTDFGEVAEQARYPSASASRKAVLKRILNPWNIARSGYLWLINAVVACCAYFGATVPDSSRGLFGAADRPPQEGIFGWIYQKVFELPGGPNIKVFGSSILVFLLLCLSVFLITRACRYRDRLEKKARTGPVSALPYWPIWFFWIGAILTPYLGLWIFGRHPTPTLVSDLILLITITLALVLLPFFGAGVGATFHSLKGKIGFALLGLFCGIVQIGVPLLLAMRPHWLSSLIAIALALTSIWIGLLLVKKNQFQWLVALFLGHGVLQLLLPFLIGAAHPGSAWGALIAFGFGAAMGCLWFGGYLAVAITFNGHNNEAGGAARVEQYKEFVRCRISKEKDGTSTLTAYVIGVDDPCIPGHKLRPKVVDFFQLQNNKKG